MRSIQDKMQFCTLICCVLVTMVVQSASTAGTTAGLTAGGLPATTDILVIGAGIAGLTAARNLTDAGYGQNLLILEARQRTGGRMWTVDVPGIQYPVDLGCFYWENVDVNQLVPVAEAANITLVPFDTTDSNVFDNGRSLSATDIMGLAVSPAEDAWSRAQPFVQQGTTLQEAFALGGYRYNRYVETYLQYAWEQTSGDNNEYIDATAVEDPFVPSNGAYKVAPGGYSQILHHITTQPTDLTNKIRLGIAVYKIDYGSNSGQIKVYYNNTNTGVLGVITATRGLVLTVPLGVLKSGAIQFTPSLPPNMQTSIRDLRFGAANRAVLVFDSQGENLLNHQKYAANNLFRIGQGSSLRFEDPITFFLNHQYIFGGNQPVLTSFVVGDFARRWEGWTDASIVSKTMAALREFIPNLPDPIDSIVTHWQSDPFAQGVYTYYGRGTNYSNVLTFQQPLGVNGNMVLAGEHTQAQEIGSANGAYVSGLQAAVALVNAIKSHRL